MRLSTVGHAIASLFLLCSGYPVVTHGQEPIDEIVVTADLRGRTLSEFPASVTVLEKETINATSIQHFEELIAALPNLNWSGDGHRARYLQIRGVGELAQYQGAPNPSVGFIIDDIDFSGIGTIATLYDIGRVEVLRGPQGTRYGANALAGLITMRSVAPGESFSGNVRLLAGDDDAFGVGIALGGPVGRNNGFRLSANHFQSDGFRNNPFLGRDDTNGRDETSVRARLDWEVAEHWSFSTSAMLSDVDDGYDAFAIDNSLTVLSDKPGRDTQRSVGASLRAVWTGHPKFLFTSITSIADSDIEFSFDADWGNDEAWAPVQYDFVSLNDRQRRTYSQEFRLASTMNSRLFAVQADWLVGLYVNKMDEDLATTNTGEYFDPGFNFADSLDDRLQSAFAATNSAVFGQLDFDLSAVDVLTVGARVERRSIDYGDSNGLAIEPAESMFGGEVSWSHKFAERITGYASLSRGYKAGGFNLGFVPVGRREFGAETMTNFEVGLKATLAEGRIRLNAAAFHSWRDDQQVETSFQLVPNDPASFVFFTDNAASGQTLGLEADVNWLVSDAFEIFGSLGLLQAEFDSFSTPQVSISGRDQAHAPNYTASLGAAYRHQSGWFARIDVTAKDDYYFDVSHNQKSNSYAISNGRIGFVADNWNAELWLRNIFDERYAVRGFFFGNEPPNFPPALFIRQGDPRQIGVTLTLEF